MSFDSLSSQILTLGSSDRDLWRRGSRLASKSQIGMVSWEIGGEAVACPIA
jgi:hypothetical protein